MNFLYYSCYLPFILISNNSHIFLANAKTSLWDVSANGVDGKSGIGNPYKIYISGMVINGF